MTCDSAYLYPDQRFEAFGRVKINKDSTTILGQYMEYDSKTDAGRITGRIVRMIDGKTTLRTPVVEFNTANNNASFHQGATVSNDDLTLESERGYYNSESKVFVFFSKVQLKNKEYTVLSDSMHYDNSHQISFFFKPTKIWHKDGFLSCNYGKMNTKSDDFYFSDKAYILTKDQEIWSDEAQYNRKKSEGEFKGNIQMLDTTRGMYVFGNYAYFDQAAKKGLVTKHPVVGYYSDNPKEDTLFMTADTLRILELKNPEYTKALSEQYRWDSLNNKIAHTDSKLSKTKAEKSSKGNKLTKWLFSKKENETGSSKSAQNSEQRKQDSLFKAGPRPTLPDSSYTYAKAYHKVRAFRKDLQWVCDSLNYTSKDSLAELFYDPVIWSEANQIVSKKVELYVKHKQVERMEFTEDVMISSVDDSIKKLYNQVKGKSATGWFKNNELYRYDIFGNSQSIYFMREKNKLSGVNISESTDMKIYVKNRAIQRINYLTKPESRMVPQKMMADEELELKGFVWKADVRPKSKTEICPYVKRKSERKKVSTYVKPTFPITERIQRLSR